VIGLPSRVIRSLSDKQKKYEDLAKAAKVGPDADVERMIEEARQTLEAKAERSWLVWAGERFLPGLAREEEQAAAAQVLAEPTLGVGELQTGFQHQIDDQRNARILRRVAREDDAQEKRDGLHKRYQAQSITPEYLVAQMEQIDRDLAAANQADASDGGDEAMDVDDGEDELDDDDAGEDDEDGDDADEDDDGAPSGLPAIKVSAGAAKRKRAATPESGPGLVSQNPKVHRRRFLSFLVTLINFVPTVRPLRRDGQQSRVSDGAGRDTLPKMREEPEEV
jgi:hypothetical protein